MDEGLWRPRRSQSRKRQDHDAHRGGVRAHRTGGPGMILDTNALSAWADGAASVHPALSSAARLVLPAVVLGEYLFGILQSRHRRRYEQWLAANLPVAELATIGRATAREYAGIRLELKQHATPIPANDAWIAALARQHGLPVLSNDSHFDAVSGIQRISF